MPTPRNETKSRVVTNPNILSGTPIVLGTRVPAGNILAEMKAGKNKIEILRIYPSLPFDAIEAVTDWERKGCPR